MAKQRQVFVNARLGQLKARMGELALVNLTNIPRDQRRLRLDRHRLRHYQQTRRSNTSSSPAKSPTSTKASSPPHRPSAEGSSGKQVGDIATVVTPNGKQRELEVLKLVTIHDEIHDDIKDEAE